MLFSKHLSILHCHNILHLWQCALGPIFPEEMRRGLGLPEFWSNDEAGQTDWQNTCQYTIILHVNMLWLTANQLQHNDCSCCVAALFTVQTLMANSRFFFYLSHSRVLWRVSFENSMIETATFEVLSFTLLSELMREYQVSWKGYKILHA